MNILSFLSQRINVSIVLKALGVESTALGFIAGFIGDEIEILNFAYKSFDEEIYQNQLLAKQDVVSNTLIKAVANNPILSNSSYKVLFK